MKFFNQDRGNQQPGRASYNGVSFLANNNAVDEACFKKAMALGAVQPLLDCRPYNGTKQCSDVKVRVNQRVDRGNTALHYAAFHCYPQMASRLMELGANSTLRNDKQFTPGQLAQLSCLMSISVDQKSRCERTVLLFSQSIPSVLSEENQSGIRPSER